MVPYFKLKKKKTFKSTEKLQKILEKSGNLSV